MVVSIGLVCDFRLTRNSPTPALAKESSPCCVARLNGADSEWLKIAGQALEGLCAGQSHKWPFQSVSILVDVFLLGGEGDFRQGDTRLVETEMLETKLKRGQARTFCGLWSGGIPAGPVWVCGCVHLPSFPSRLSGLHNVDDFNAGSALLSVGWCGLCPDARLGAPDAFDMTRLPGLRQCGLHACFARAGKRIQIGSEGKWV